MARALRNLREAGYPLVVISNQSGIGRGMYDEPTLAQIHEHMRARVRAAGGELAGVYYCPHLPEDGCECRKPKPGMFRALERELGVGVVGAPYIGDRLSDVEAAQREEVAFDERRIGEGGGARHDDAGGQFSERAHARKGSFSTREHSQRPADR